MPRFSHRSKAVTLTALAPVLAFGLAACGGSSSGSSASASTPNASATGAPGQGPAGGGFGGADFTKIQACLSAAGISLPTGTGGPRPSRSPGATPPSGAAGVRPSGAADGGAFGGLFASAQVQAALKACGITVPTGGARLTATPTS